MGVWIGIRMLNALSIWFVYPALLGLLAALPALALLFRHARRRRLQDCARLGQPAALHKLHMSSGGSHAHSARSWRTVGLFFGLALLILGAAGPRWGQVRMTTGAGPERDLVLVLDVSRSMLAEQPSRLELAKRALRHLAAALTEHGGPRLALVIFAAHPQLVFPLTGDYDHLLDALRRIDADDLPPSLRPHGDDGSVSGTRIGAALRLALHVLDAKAGGDMLLLSDGDDPAGDEEWLQGAEEARRHHVAVHVVGIGNPREASVIPLGDGVLEFGGQPVHTRLNEKALEEIARRTGGTYVPARTTTLSLGTLLPSILASRFGIADSAPESTLLVLQPRYPWFLGPALVLLILSLMGGECRPQGRSALARLLLLPLLTGLLSAAPLPRVDLLLRKGYEAFERGQNNEALEFFQQAEELAPDPALVSFNEAAVLYRLERYAEAALHYQRCLEDLPIPPTRRCRAYFQMGNAYLRDSKGTSRPLLEKALDAYRACLLLEPSVGPVRSDARHNLEIARLLWLKSLPNPEENPGNGANNSREKRPNHKRPEPGKQDVKDDASPGKTDDPGTGPADAGKENAGAKAKKAQSGPLTVLEDTSELVPLSPGETEAHLSAIARRILQERRQYRRHALTVPENVKDW